MIAFVGSAVTSLQIGDRVAIEPGVPCGECKRCSQGEYNLCLSVEFSGAPPVHGSMRRYHVHPAKYLHKMPDALSFRDGALLEPLSVVMHGFERSPVRLGECCVSRSWTILLTDDSSGEPTVICGAGPIGLIALAVARASGASPIVITDIDPGRLDFAKTFIPSCLPVLVQPELSAEDMAAVVRSKLGDEPPRVVYECTGVQRSVITAAHLPQQGGEVMVIGVGRPKMDGIPFMHISFAEVSISWQH